VEDFSSLTDRYSGFTTHEKFHFFECTAHESLSGVEELGVHKFLSSIILNSHENSNIRKKAIELHTNYILINKLKARYALSLLIDAWPNPHDIFLEVHRLKDLFLFYELDPDSIVDVYRLGISSAEIEIQSESYFYLGLIHFLSALKADEVDSRKLFQQSINDLESAFSIIENRTDAEFFRAVVAFVLDLLKGRKESVDYHLSVLAEILWRRDALSICGLNSPFQISFYRILFSMSKASQLLKSTWLDYRENFARLHYYFCEIKNDELKNRLSHSLLSSEFSNYCVSNFFEPYILLSPAYELAKIDERLKELNIDSDEYRFLNDLKAIEVESHLKKKIGIEDLLNRFSQIFPEKNLSAITSIISNVKSSNDVNLIFQAVHMLTAPSMNNFLDYCIYACVELQSNRIFIDGPNITEDDRNTFIASLLSAKGWLVRDQTRRGESYQGKAAGEIDIFVALQNGLPFAIIEALNLNSLDKAYVDLHLKKIFGYDTAGLKQNLIIVYSSAKNFSGLWKKYYDHLAKVDYPYPIDEYSELESMFSDIKLARTTHIRQDDVVTLFHIMVNMRKHEKSGSARTSAKG
jgi:hypothetical protein